MIVEQDVVSSIGPCTLLIPDFMQLLSQCWVGQRVLDTDSIVED